VHSAWALVDSRHHVVHAMELVQGVQEDAAQVVEVLVRKIWGPATDATAKKHHVVNTA